MRQLLVDIIDIGFHGLQIRLVFHQEGIVAVVGFDLDVLYVAPGFDEVFDQCARARGGETPVGGEAGDEKFGLGLPQCRNEVVAEGGGGAEVVQHFGHPQVGVGIEAFGKFVALIELEDEKNNPLLNLDATAALPKVIGSHVEGGYPMPQVIELIGSYGFDL